MLKIIRLAFSYMRHYKKQTIATFLGVAMSAVLISGIGSLMYSGRIADLENARRLYGDYHYIIPDEDGWYDRMVQNPDSKGYSITGYGVLTVKRVIEEPYKVTFCSADEGYMKAVGKTFIKGGYPNKPDEIALDWHSANNLGASGNIGDSIEICGDSYIISGIIDEGAGDDVVVFVSSDSELDMEGKEVYLKFDEKRSVFEQLSAFVKDYGIDFNTIERNENVTAYVGGEKEESLIDTLKVSIMDSNAGLVYFLGSLNENKTLMNNVVFVLLLVFGAFVMYSLYEVSVVKRTGQYAVMQVIGLEPKHLFFTMLAELFAITSVGYLAGCVLGNVAAKLVYSNIGTIFSDVRGGMEFYVSKPSIWQGAVFYVCFIAVICFIIIRRMGKTSDMQMIRNNITYRRFKRKIHSKSSRNLTGVLTKRFMFGRIGTFAGIIISLSLGGVIFLSTTYTAESTKKNNNHAFRTDEGLASDIKVYIDSDNGAYTIPQSAVDGIKEIDGIHRADEVSYMLGEIFLENGIFKWKEFYPEISGGGQKQEQRIIDNYNGIIVQQGRSSYRLKVNVYGYSDDMVNDLNDYLLDGEINVSDIKDSNSIIIKTLTDGQGNTDGVDIKPGDKITLKVPETMNNPEVLRFEATDGEYIQKEFTVAAVVNRPLGKNEHFIGDNGTDTVDIIMTNRQMEENFGVTGYNSVSVSLDNIEDSTLVAGKIHTAINGLGRCMVKEYCNEINRRNSELKQKVWFFYGIAFVLFCISILHIANSMKFIIISRRHEFGIMRAMGITDSGFIKMLISEGVRYGIYTSILMMAVYFAVHQVIHYMMVHLFLYIIAESDILLVPCLIMAAVNIFVCIVSVIMAGREVLKEDIISGIMRV